MDDHPSFEDLSAYYDGEAPEWEPHVAACAVCQGTLAALADLSAAVASPVPVAPTAAGTDDPVARAVAAFTSPTAERRPEAAPGALEPDVSALRTRPPRPPRSRRWVVPAMAAAAVAVVFAGVAVLLGQSNGSDTTTAVGPPPAAERATPNAQSGGAAADSATAESFDAADLGDIPDPAALVAKVQPGLAGARQATAAVPASPASSAVPGGLPLPERRVVGTRPCEVEAREAGRAALGEVVYFATARSGGTPAVVLAFAPATESNAAAGPVTVQLRASSGCRLLLEATTP